MKTIIGQVYFNLHKKCWSVKTRIPVNAAGKLDWRVTHHFDSIVARPIKYTSRDGTRQAIIRKGSKEICAFVICEILDTNCAKPDTLGDTISYNPYYANFFYTDDDKQPIDESKYSELFFDKATKKAHEVL